MSTKPILFNTDMVRAILAGRKTVTRRVVKPHYRVNEIGFNIITNANTGKYVRIEYFDEWENETRYMADPYRPGDILYVRETFKIDCLSNIPGSGRIRYKADDTYADFTFKPDRYEMMRRAQLKPGWRPNENMPREVARIFLLVTDVWAERLQDITEEQAIMEGIRIGMGGEPYFSCRDAFIPLWNSTIKPADRALYGWEANPWVWVIRFGGGVKNYNSELE